MDEHSPPALPAGAPHTARGGGRALAVFALLLALGAAAASVWLWTGLQDALRAQQQLREALARMPAPAADRSAELTARLDAVAGADAALQARAAALEQAQAALQAALEERRKTDTGLAEAEYLQRLAAHSLLMGREVRGAIALLESSDRILAERDDPALHTARELLARDLAALRAVAAFDVEGAWLRLAALSAAVPGLVFTERRLPQPDALPAAAAADADWSTRIARLLERFVVVRRDAPPVRALLAPADEQMIRMQLGLALEQAKLALMAAQPEVYRGALADAEQLLRAQFDPEAAANRAFQAELSRLAAERIAPDLPDLSEALRALRDAAQAAGGSR